MLEPRILFEDTHLIVLSKPAGMLSQEDGSGAPSLVTWLQKYVGRNYVGLVHRLDRNTAGLMIAAKRTKSARRLTEYLQKGELKRTYLAILDGLSPAEGRLENYLFKDEKTNKVEVVSKDKRNAKLAVLNYRTLKAAKKFSAVHVELETGRSHQIRAQFSYAGFPVVGDKKYGSKTNFDRPALHSYTLTVPHPMTDEILNFKDSLPNDLIALVPGIEKCL